MIVAVALFTVVSVASVGSILIILDANRRARATEVVFNNINFVLEDMTRRARTGTTFHCQLNGPPSSVETSQDCPIEPGGRLFAFEKEQLADSDPSNQIVYWLDNHPTVVGGWQLRKSSNGGANFAPVTPNEVVIEHGGFTVRGATVANEQAYAIIVLNGYVELGRARTPFALQSAITQRVPDF